MTREQAHGTALNFAVGYITALAGWAEDANKRESARQALESINEYIDSVAFAGLRAHEQADTREQADTVPYPDFDTGLG